MLAELASCLVDERNSNRKLSPVLSPLGMRLQSPGTSISLPLSARVTVIV